MIGKTAVGGRTHPDPKDACLVNLVAVVHFSKIKEHLAAFAELRKTLVEGQTRMLETQVDGFQARKQAALVTFWRCTPECGLHPYSEFANALHSI